MRYEPKPWEHIEDRILHGPGYAYDLDEDDLLFFVSPGGMRSGLIREEERSDGNESGGPVERRTR